MAIKIILVKNGPIGLKAEGEDFPVLQAPEGNDIGIDAPVFLCRCGASQAKPNCDGQHQEREFLHAGKMTEVSELPASPRASKITISCIKDGPITFRGRLRLHNEFGQECVKMRGSLCRCGQSTNKPFCDGSHQRVGFKSGCG